MSEKESLDSLTINSDLITKLSNNRVQCHACGLRCKISEGRRGACKIRYNKEGELRVPFGYVGALQLDPIEKTPFMHSLPGQYSLSFGMLGCNMKCAYCQNWEISQVLRDQGAPGESTVISVKEIIDIALHHNVGMVTSSLNEPLITAEWAIEIFRLAQVNNLSTGFISNGNATEDVLDFIKPYTDCYKIDLKTMSKSNYRSLGAPLNNVLNTIEMVYEKGFWLEIVTVLVPGWNNSTDEIRSMAKFIASISPDIPWIIWNFHKDYKMTDPDDATADDLINAAGIAKNEGLNYVYAGVMPGLLGKLENTHCHNCNNAVIKRTGYQVTEYCLTTDGKCPYCKTKIPGRWPKNPSEVPVGPPASWPQKKSKRLI